MALFEKKPDAPSGTVIVTVDNVTTVFEDDVQVDVTDPDTVQYLLAGTSRYIQLVDGQDPWVPPRPAKYPVYSSGLPNDGDGMFYDEQNNEWRPSPVATQAQIALKADLNGGKIVTSQIPDMAITATKSVPDRAGMLALDAQTNDLAIVAEDDDGESRTYVLVGDDPSIFMNWVVLSSPGNVTSVNSQVGVVNLGPGDVGAVQRITTPGTIRAYSIEANGSQSSRQIDSGAVAGSIASRDASARLSVADGTAASHAVNKAQLDTKVQSTSNALRLYGTDNTGAAMFAAYSANAAAAEWTFVQRSTGGYILVRDGVNADHAVSKAQLDTKLGVSSAASGNVYIKNSGGTPTGLVYNSALAPVVGVVSVMTRSTEGRTQIADAVGPDDAVTKRQLDTKVDAVTANSKVYITTNAGVQGTLDRSVGLLPNSIVQRDENNNFSAAPGTSPSHVVVKSQLDTKVDKVTTPSRVYAVDSGGNQVAFPYGNAFTVTSGFVFRDANGRFQCADGSSNNDVINKGQLDARLSAAQRTAINALPTSGATVDQVVAALKAT